mgnify:FL=1|jgi:Cys-tRNA(Pro) deacylase|tara:strand:- start:1685 stop:2167 length:483 start_codon:yes stop_codon:yes gene_type:complete
MEDLLLKEPVQRVVKKLSEFDNSIKVTVLDSSARTASDAAQSLNTEVGSIVKSLLLRSKNSFLLCLVAGDKRCSLNKVKKILNEKDLSMASADQVKEITGFTIGGVSPIGHITRLNVYIDGSLERFANVFAAGGHPNVIFKIQFKKLIEITKGTIKEISE